MEIQQIERTHEFYDDDRTSAFRDLIKTERSCVTTWLGATAIKSPLDLFIYAEIIHTFRPDVIVEGGSAGGGSTLFMATVMDALDHGRIVSYDISKNERLPTHPRIEWMLADTLSEDARASVGAAFSGAERRMLILDDGHDQDHVATELRNLALYLRKGDWLIVEDTDLGGPYWGLRRFLATEPEGSWVPQAWCEKYLMTHNPRGYWRRA